MTIVKLEQVYKNKIKKYSKELLKDLDQLSEETKNELDEVAKALNKNITVRELINNVRPALEALTKIPNEESL
jgi:hypothetical protein